MNPNKIFSVVNYLIAAFLIIMGFVLLPFGLIAILAAIVLIVYTLKTTKQVEKDKFNIDSLQNKIDELTSLLNEPLYLQYSESKEERERIEKEIEYKKSELVSFEKDYERKQREFLEETDLKIQSNNNSIAELIEKRKTLYDEISKLEKKRTTAQNRLNKCVEVYNSVRYSTDAFYEGRYEPESFTTKQLANEIEELSPSVMLKLHSMDMKDLNKAYRQNDKDIQSVTDAYVGRYLSASNQSIYKLMVIALRAELQNILTDLKYEKLDNAISKVEEMTSKYLAIASKGNQTIAGTLTRFIGQIEYLFINAVKIEYNYYVKKEQSRQEQLAIREQMRLEAQERKALEEEKKKIEKEESKFKDEIDKVKAQLATAHDSEMEVLNAKIAELQSQLASVVLKKDEIVNLQNGKAGNIYIISNLGSFGEDVFKVGMTRRIDPQDRVNELGDASVPFKFDVHSFIFSEDAVDLEKKLHTILNEKRVNKVNLRKEFFRISLDELEKLVLNVDPTAEFNRTMAAEEFRQSQSTNEVYTTDFKPEEDSV